MTALSVSAPLSTTRLRLTARGRRLLAVAAALPAVVVLGTAIIGGSAALASRDAGTSAESFTTVTVMYGESLWSIAEQIAPQADPRDVVDDITRLNALESPIIEPGQSLAIPAEYVVSP